MDMGLAGKVVLITGGSGEIGRASARMFAGERASVAVADLRPEAVEAVAAELRGLGATAIGIAADVSKQESVRDMVRRVLDELGRLDVLFNCAGIFQSVPPEELSLADWQRVLDVNLTGMFLCCQAAMPVMRAQGGGRIINIGSLAGQVGGFASGINYSVSKAGVMCMTKSLARALGGSGVTVNTINPGPIEGSMVAAWPPGQREIQLERMPVGRFGQPEEIAATAVFLASRHAGYIHGAHIDVNGGLLMD